MGSFEMSQKSAEEKKIQELEQKISLLKSETADMVHIVKHHVSNTNIIDAIDRFTNRNNINQLKQLRFTTTKPMGMFQMISVSKKHEPLSVPENAGEFIQDKVKGKGAYIHGKAEHLAGFDIITWIDGNLAQLDLPIEYQDILMVIPSGEYQCKAEYCTEDGAKDKYLITLKKEPKVFK